MTRPTSQRDNESRELGSWKGRVWLAPDWDSDETNEEIAQLFYGEDDESDPLLKPPEPQA